MLFSNETILIKNSGSLKQLLDKSQEYQLCFQRGGGSRGLNVPLVLKLCIGDKITGHGKEL